MSRITSKDGSALPRLNAKWSLGVMIAAAAVAGCDSGAPSGDNVGWAGYNKGYDGQRFAALNEINTKNASRLKPLCELTLGEGGAFQTGPVVSGDTMFLTTARATISMNATTCAVNWRHVDSSERPDPVPVNRGAAYLEGRLYRGMPGARLAALDATSGKVLWDVKVGDVSVGEFISSGPIPWGGGVFGDPGGCALGIPGGAVGFGPVAGKQVSDDSSV